MYEDICALLGCKNPFHDHNPQEKVLGLSQLVDTEDPAFIVIAHVLTDMLASGVKLTRPTVDAAIHLGRYYHSTGARPPLPERTTNGMIENVVYYMRFGNLIKIGTTTALSARTRQLRPDEVMAAEPGSYDLERKRHQQFAAFRLHGEYFHPAALLMLHIRKIRGRHLKPPKNPPKTARQSTVVADLLPPWSNLGTSTVPGPE